MSALEEFNAWVQEIGHEVDHVQGIMSKKLSDEPEELINDLQEIEAWNSRMGALLAIANRHIELTRAELMPSKDWGTEFGRKTYLDGKVSAVRAFRNTLESVCDSIKQRLILGESCLSYYKSYAERKGKDIRSMEKIY